MSFCISIFLIPAPIPFLLPFPFSIHVSILFLLHFPFPVPTPISFLLPIHVHDHIPLLLPFFIPISTSGTVFLPFTIIPQLNASMGFFLLLFVILVHLLISTPILFHVALQLPLFPISITSFMITTSTPMSSIPIIPSAMFPFSIPFLFNNHPFLRILIKTQSIKNEHQILNRGHRWGRRGGSILRLALPSLIFTVFSTAAIAVAVVAMVVAAVLAALRAPRPRRQRSEGAYAVIPRSQ